MSRVLVIGRGAVGWASAINAAFAASGVALNAIAVLEADGQAPEWICLIPAGDVIGRDGRGWINDRPDLVLDAFASNAMDLPLDMEHATELKATQGDPAPAVGWIKELQNRGGQIWGRVDWTETGRNAVESKAYRYVSPVIVFERASKRVVALTSVGLTNRPNLFLQALNGREEHMDLKKLLAALGLPETASFDEALAHMGKLKGDLATALNATPSLDKFVPRADHDAAIARALNAEQKLTALNQVAQEEKIDAAITKALAEGKITPATKDYHKAQCAQEGGLDRFAAYCQAAPVIGDPSAMDGKRPADQGKALNAEELAISEMFGNSAEDLQKYGK
jgi:phage I-like protein